MNWKVGDRIETRVAYGEALLELGRQRDDIVVMDADLQRSNKTYEFGKAHPDRFFDMGIAEADMISTGAGMAAMGMTVFATSFAMFVPGRCYDQIRLQVAYGRANVKLVGVSAGLTEGPDGATHQSLDDIALMRQLPNMTVIVPADATEAYSATLAAAELQGPAYIRLGRYPTRVLFDARCEFRVGTAHTVRKGTDVVLFATGIMVAEAIDAADILARHAIDASVVNVSTIKPLDAKAIFDTCVGKSLAVTMEEHSVIGGLGSAVSEILAESARAPRLLRIGVEDVFGQSGTADELLEHYGLMAPQVAQRIRTALDR
jgi:transketolase